MIRTVTIPSGKLEQLVSELQHLGKSIMEKGGKVVVDDAKGTVELDGISLKITGKDTCVLVIEGNDGKSEDIEYLVRSFSKYQ